MQKEMVAEKIEHRLKAHLRDFKLILGNRLT